MRTPVISKLTIRILVTVALALLVAAVLTFQSSWLEPSPRESPDAWAQVDSPQTTSQEAPRDEGEVSDPSDEQRMAAEASNSTVGPAESSTETKPTLASSFSSQAYPNRLLELEAMVFELKNLRGSKLRDAVARAERTFDKLVHDCLKEKRAAGFARETEVGVESSVPDADGFVTTAYRPQIPKEYFAANTVIHNGLASVVGFLPEDEPDLYRIYLELDSYDN